MSNVILSIIVLLRLKFYFDINVYITFYIFMTLLRVLK
jgi:hypothetical protein